jgi:L-asparagine transporter-like permease
MNSFSVKSYGEFEFWLAGIKIAMIIIFIILGASILFGILPGFDHSFSYNFTEYGGFFPNGWTAIIPALIVVMFSYGGSELIGLTLTEAEDAEKVVPRVVKSFILRVILFYTLPILIICGLIPWNQISEQTSPFVQVLSTSGLQGATHVMNFILITAVLSAGNSGIYGATRMLHSLAKDGEAPPALGKLSKKGVPVNSLKLCAIILLSGSVIAYFVQDQLFPLLMAVPGFVVSIVWLVICVTQLKLRKDYPVEPSFKIWGFPWLTIFTIVSLSIIGVLFLLDSSKRISIGICILVMVLLVIWSFVKFRPVRGKK